MDILITAMVGIIGAIIGASISSTTLYRLTKKNLLVTSRQAVVSDMSEIDKIFINHPELYKYFYENEKEFKNDNERIMAIAISHCMMNHFAILLLNQEDYPKVFNEWVDNTIAKRYGTSPILAETLIKFKDEFRITGKRQLELMQKGIIENQAIQSNNFKKEIDTNSSETGDLPKETENR